MRNPPAAMILRMYLNWVNLNIPCWVWNFSDANLYSELENSELERKHNRASKHNYVSEGGARNAAATNFMQYELISFMDLSEWLIFWNKPKEWFIARDNLDRRSFLDVNRSRLHFPPVHRAKNSIVEMAISLLYFHGHVTAHHYLSSILPLTSLNFTTFSAHLEHNLL